MVRKNKYILTHDNGYNKYILTHDNGYLRIEERQQTIIKLKSWEIYVLLWSVFVMGLACGLTA